MNAPRATSPIVADLYKIEWHLCNPDGQLNIPAISAYADELQAKPIKGPAVQFGSTTVTYDRHLSRDEAMDAAIRFAQFERQQNWDKDTRNKAWRLQKMCQRRDAERIAATLSAEQIQFEIQRRSFGSFATCADNQQELETYYEAQGIQAKGVQALEAAE